MMHARPLSSSPRGSADPPRYCVSAADRAPLIAKGSRTRFAKPAREGLAKAGIGTSVQRLILRPQVHLGLAFPFVFNRFSKD
jgi:hypothetical protein